MKGTVLDVGLPPVCSKLDRAAPVVNPVLRQDRGWPRRWDDGGNWQLRTRIGFFSAAICEQNE